MRENKTPKQAVLNNQPIKAKNKNRFHELNRPAFVPSSQRTLQPTDNNTKLQVESHTSKPFT